MKTFDVVVVGAGVIGLSIAYHLSLRGHLKIAVIEKEKFPCMGSTAYCTGGIRHQFSNPVNVAMTKISLPYFMGFENDMGYPIHFRHRGYLFVSADPCRLTQFRENLALLKSFDIPAEFMTGEELATRYPFINCADLAGGTFCPLDAYADPYGVTMGYFQQARKRGVEVFFREEVSGLEVAGGGIKGVITPAGRIYCPVVVNAAGPHLPEIGKTVGVDIPARPFKRQVYVCSPLEGIPGDAPLVVDMDTGFYLHAEKNGTLILGGTDRDSHPGMDTAVNWPLLDGFIESAVRRIPLLQEGKLVKAFVGIRSLTPDYLGILGEHPALRGFFVAGGFAGNGFMHAPAIGLIAAQLITEGRCDLLDTAPLSPARLYTESEKNIF
ncbi:MAG: FAD-binding oxidoreductase [Peptococcaceae bacterium]|nr:FAD-binding oxidoreductase [Peptococcaceae bacterium]